MPAFPERESSLISKLNETAPWTAKLHQNVEDQSSPERADVSAAVTNGPTEPAVNIGMPVDPLVSTGELRFHTLPLHHKPWIRMNALIQSGCICKAFLYTSHIR